MGLPSLWEATGSYWDICALVCVLIPSEALVFISTGSRVPKRDCILSLKVDPHKFEGGAVQDVLMYII
jgi:hypothetical protein